MACPNCQTSEMTDKDRSGGHVSAIRSSLGDHEPSIDLFMSAPASEPPHAH